MYDLNTFAQWNQFSQAAIARFVRLNQISAAAIEKMTRQQMAQVELNVKAGMEKAQSLKDLKDMQALMSLQPQLALEAAETFKAQAQELVNILLEAQAEITSLAEESMKEIVPAAPAAPAAKAPARRRAA